MSNSLRVQSLDAIKVGETDDAKLVAALLGAYDGTLIDGLTDLAHQCAVDEWAVYRWLRGIHKPRTGALRRLNLLATDRNVILAPVPDAT